VTSERFVGAIAAIDRANAEDPNELVYRGVARPKELVHGEMMGEWVLRLDPDADEAQLLAARAHHFRRWASPRSDYPEGRAGYLKWRTRAKQRHAEEVGALLGAHGYDDGTVARVGAIIRKERRTSDAAVQTHEDALCLVFLDTQLEELADKLGDDEVVEILVKTIPKISEHGIAAVAQLDLSPRGVGLVTRAVSERQGDPLA
jgi:Domain of unknown function (DUF4202)